MASQCPSPWTWVWLDSRSWWWTGRPGVLRFMGSQFLWKYQFLVMFMYVLKKKRGGGMSQGKSHSTDIYKWLLSTRHGSMHLNAWKCQVKQNQYFVYWKILTAFQFSSVQSLSRARLFATPWITARQASLSITNSRSLLRLMSIESVMPSSRLILCRDHLSKWHLKERSPAELFQAGILSPGSSLCEIPDPVELRLLGLMLSRLCPSCEIWDDFYVVYIFIYTITYV